MLSIGEENGEDEKEMVLVEERQCYYFLAQPTLFLGERFTCSERRVKSRYTFRREGQLLGRISR